MLLLTKGAKAAVEAAGGKVEGNPRVSMSPSSSGHVNMMKGQPFHVKYREIIRRLMFLIGAFIGFRLGAHIPYQALIM